MNVIVIGSSYCQDTLYALMKLKDAGVKTEFRNLATNFTHLKEYLNLRDTHPFYVSVKERDLLGMPFIRFSDGTETLYVKEALEIIKSRQ